MNKPEPAMMLKSLVERPEIDSRTQQWLRAGFQRWLSSHGQLSLTACLGVPTKPDLVMKKIRNAYLIQAASLLGGPTWTRAVKLHREVQRFDFKWKRWSAAGVPPERASALDCVLFSAFQVGAQMPGTVQGIRNALGDIESVPFPSQRPGEFGCEVAIIEASSIDSEEHEYSGCT